MNETYLVESTTSIGSSPVAICMVSPTYGLVERCIAAAGGTTTGTITVAVNINGSSSDICSSNLTIVAGSSARIGTVVELPLYGDGASSGNFLVNEGDCITFTPSGGGGSSIPGAFAAVIRPQR
jgi:hypothetical protein